jgi:hypothetical protein
MIKLIAFLSTGLGQTVVAVAGGTALFFTWLAFHDAKVANKATAKVVTSLNTQAEKLGHEAIKARQPAQRAGAALRLRNATHCRDCDE